MFFFRLLRPNTHVLCVSSSKDIHSTVVYPTHPYSIKRNFPNLKFLPDPCIININGLSIGVTATDTLKHLLDEELTL